MIVWILLFQGAILSSVRGCGLEDLCTDGGIQIRTVDPLSVLVPQVSARCSGPDASSSSWYIRRYMNGNDSLDGLGAPLTLNDSFHQNGNELIIQQVNGFAEGTYHCGVDNNTIQPASLCLFVRGQPVFTSCSGGCSSTENITGTAKDSVSIDTRVTFNDGGFCGRTKPIRLLRVLKDQERVYLCSNLVTFASQLCENNDKFRVEQQQTCNGSDITLCKYDIKLVLLDFNESDKGIYEVEIDFENDGLEREMLSRQFIITLLSEPSNNNSLTTSSTSFTASFTTLITLSDGAISGIVVPIILLGILIPAAALCAFCYYKRKKKKTAAPGPSPLSPPSDPPCEEENFPYLRIRGLSKEEKKRLIGRLEEESLNIRDKFGGLLVKTTESLSINEISIDSLKVLLHTFKIKITESDVEVGKLLSKAFEHCSFFSFRILKEVIQNFGLSKDNENLKSYESSFKTYCKHRLDEVPINKRKPSMGHKINIKTDKTFNVPAIEVYILQNELEKILGKPVYLAAVKKGCVELIVYVLHELNEIFPLNEKQMDQLKELGVLKVYSDHEEYYSIAHPLKVDCVMEVLETLPWREVGKMLYVPDSKLDTMDADHTTNKGKKEAVIEYWILKDPSASWRRLIYTLDKLDKIDIADQIRKYAEKQTDSSLTCQTLLNVLDTVKNANNIVELEFQMTADHGILENLLQIPKTKAKEMRSSQLTENEYRKKLVEYYISIYPLASWNYVAGNINYYGQFGASKKVKENKNTYKDLSLISKNLTELLKDVKDWNKIAYGLDIPETQCANFRTYSNESECKEACWDWYLKNRPSPTWKRIANELYQIYEHEVLEKLKRQYFEYDPTQPSSDHLPSLY